MIRARGFTLIEILVVLVIFSVISLLAYGSLTHIVRSRAAVDVSLNRTAQLQKAFRRLRDDFQLLRPRPVRDSYGTQRAALVGVREPRVEFTHAGWRNPLQSPRPDLERVSYSLKDKKLLRESFRVLDQAQDSQPVGVTLLDQVKELRLRYLNADREWVEEWPPLSATGATQGADAGPPRAVEITLETEAEGELTYLFNLGLDPQPQGFKPGQPVQPAAKTGKDTTTTPDTGSGGGGDP